LNHEELTWWHTIVLPDGQVTKGQHDYRGHESTRFLMPEDLTGKTVLDVGTYDGFFAIEAKRRGAKNIIALDIEKRETAKLALGAYGINYCVSPDFTFDRSYVTKQFCNFDVVLCYGVIYHLRNPMQGLFNCYDALVPGGTMIVESAVDQGQASHIAPSIPAWWCAIEARHDDDPTNYWIPNTNGLAAACVTAGFKIDQVWGGEYMTPPKTRMTIRCTK
jgi:tRNA (mo5U34)-methyltransferase